MKQAKKESLADEPPPILRTWPNLYRLLIVELLALVLLFYALAKWAS